MTVNIEINQDTISTALAQAVAVLANPKAMFAEIGETLIEIHQIRFAQQQAPDGTPWQPLADWYKASKKRNADKILTADGHLRATLRYQASQKEVVFGSDRPYAAIHHFGGTIKPKGNYPLKLGAGEKTPRAMQVEIPARPWLGLSAADEQQLVEIARSHLKNAFKG
ncbi:MAG: phage virion morphogenesis protein [Pasteurellaceae bacterium]|nr:phage virion morphogenesis protein [Pasteurellaceae bacterium]